QSGQLAGRVDEADAVPGEEDVYRVEDGLIFSGWLVLFVYSGLGRPARMLPAYGTRREYIPVGSRAASLPHTVPQAGSTRAGTEPRAKRESGKEKSSRLVRTFRQRVCLARPGPAEALDG